MSRSIKLTPKQNSNLRRSQPQSNIQTQPQPQQEQEEEIQQSPNQLQLSLAVQKALEAVRKKRAERSEYFRLELDQPYTLLFDPAKMHTEEKTFNGQKSERVIHSVTDLDNREAGEKKLSLTYNQSASIEDMFSQGYTVMQVTKSGTGFDLKYTIDPIE